MKIEIYADVACPWCYIGERRLARAIAAFPGKRDMEVIFRPYQLDPDAPEIARPIPRYLARRFGRPVDEMLARVKTVAAGEGITIDWDWALAVNTRTALRLVRLAEREHGAGMQRALMERLFEAHFTRGGDIADHGQLTGLAASVGMDAERVRAYLASGEGEPELQAEIDQARARGVQAVPTLIFDGQYVVEGAQPASTFLQVLAEVQRRSAPAVSGVLPGDEDTRADANRTAGDEAA